MAIFTFFGLQHNAICRIHLVLPLFTWQLCIFYFIYHHGYFCCTLFCVLFFCSFCHGLWIFSPSFCKINVGITIFFVLMARSSFFSSFLYCFLFFGLFLFFPSSFIDGWEESQQMGCWSFLFALVGRDRSGWRGSFLERFRSVGPPSPTERIVRSRAPPDRTFGCYRRPNC